MFEGSMTMYIILAVIVILVVYLIAIYNRCVTLKNRFKNGFAQIDVQLQRRYDLIPNLVETAKSYMKHERETLENVIAARNQAAQLESQAAKSPDDANIMKKFLGAESTLMGSMGKLFALSENYPDLKANQTMQQLMEELTSTENKIGFARQAFNDAVMVYNTYIVQFPSNIIAGMFRFQAAVHFEVEEKEAKKPVKVSFN